MRRSKIRKTTINNDRLKTLVEANPCTIVRELAGDLGVTIETISNHLKELGKSKKLDKWVTYELNKNQKNRRFEIASSLILRNNNDPFLDQIVMCDKKWILYENRRQSAQWLNYDQAPQHFSKLKLHQLTVWWSGFIHHNFLNLGEIITAKKYCQQINTMHLTLRQHHPALVNRKRPILQKLNQLGYGILPHSPYSLDLSPTDYYLFKHLDNFLRINVLFIIPETVNPFPGWPSKRAAILLLSPQSNQNYVLGVVF